MKTNNIKLNITIFITFFLTFIQSNSSAQTLTEKIRINQVGFFAEGIKKAIAIDFAETNFEIWKSDQSEKVYSGRMSRSSKWDESCEDNVQIADFTSFKHEGNYIIIIGSKKSYPFIISPSALDTVAKIQMKYYYYNRSSYALLSQYAGKWARAAGHLNTQVTVLDAPTRKIFMPGGWYDAGDYGLYMVTASMAACQIMMSYEQFPDYWNKTEWNIPESGNGVPDILDEVKYELKWMYHMKDTDDGVWYKATPKSFPGFLMPDKDRSIIYCMVKNATSAYDYAATFAFAARLFKNYNAQYPGYSDSCLIAAKAAWTWGLNNESTKPGCKNPTGVSTGEYLDNIADDGNDNKVLAGVELFITTGDSSYIKPILKTALNGFVNDEANWYEKRPVACMQLALHGDSFAKNKVIEYANTQIEIQNAHSYHVNLGNTKYDFNWGSNRRISNRGTALMTAYILTKDKKYLNGVTNSMDYILGRNATGYCFISGLGFKQVMFPHHRISASDGVAYPQPGLPLQGPYYGIMGQCNPNIVSTCAAKNYIDNQCSYSTNELSIDQGSPNVFNLGGLNQYLGKSINVEIVQPLNDAIINKDSSVAIIANVTDKENSVTKVDFYSNNILVNSDVTYPYSYKLTGVPAGGYSITAIAYNAKKDSSISQIHITVGNASPRVTIDEPQNNTLVAPQQAVNLNASAYDPDGKIKKIEFYLNDSLIHTCIDTPYVYTIPSIPAGESYIYSKAYDDKDSSTIEKVKINANCNNFIQNYRFGDSTKIWLIQNTTPGNSQLLRLSNTSLLKVIILNKGKNSSQIQLRQPLPIKKGNKYYISYEAQADSICTIECTVQHESDAWDPWVKYISSIDTLKTYVQLFTHEFTATEDDEGSKIKFLLGTATASNFYFKNVEVSLCPAESAEIKSLTLIEAEKEMAVNNIFTPHVVLKNSDSIILFISSLPKINWTSSDTAIATVDTTGKIKAKAIGNAIITASLASNTSIQDDINITVKTLGINELHKLGVTVKPTITKDIISISAEEELASVQVISLTGQLIKNIDCTINQLIVSLEDITSGLYFIKVSSQTNKIIFVKIVKM